MNFGLCRSGASGSLGHLVCALRLGEQLFITNPDNKRTQAGFPAARRFRWDTKKDFQ